MAGMGELFDLMKNAKQMLEKAKSAQADLAKLRAEGTAGAGMVTARLNGLGELIGLEFDKAVVNPDDTEMLASLVIAAVADARKKTEAMRNDTLKGLAGGVDLSALGLNLPGL